MNSRFRIIYGVRERVVCLLLLLFGTLTIPACDWGAAKATSSAFTPTSPAPGDLYGPWKLGIHFSRVDPPVQAASVDGKVEVTELFSYTCRFCYTFEPHLVIWEQSKPDYIRVNRVPVVRGDFEKPLAKLYYSLRALKREDLHMSVFDTFNHNRTGFYGQTEKETFEHLSEFVRVHGISEDEFARVYNSADVEKEVAAAEKLSQEVKVENTPTLVVAGKYQSDMVRAGGDGYLMALVYELASREKRQ